MEEAQAILLNSLQSSGISLPSNLSSLKDLTSESLVSICSQFLLLIDGSFPSVPSSVPLSMADRFKICEDMASAIKTLGYGESLGFHQFLYPADEVSFKLMRFLVVKLSELSEGRKDADCNANKSYLVREDVTGNIGEATSNEQDRTDDEGGKSLNNQIAGKLGDSTDSTILQCGHVSSGKENSCSAETVRGHSEDSGNPKSLVCSDGDNVTGENMLIAEPEEKLASLQVQLSELTVGGINLQRKENMLTEAKQVKVLQVQKLEHDYATLKAALDMASDDQYSAEYFIKQLNEKVESRRRIITELESQWDCLKQASDDKKMTAGLSSQNLESGVLEKLHQLKEIERETEAAISEINRRELEHSSLLEEFQTMPKIPPRKSYIQRITEITRNSWKQDADIDKILKETRELQLESNSIRERLDRTYLVVDENVFREAKKDAMGRQVYRLLTSIHDSFEQISDKILAVDRARREAAEQAEKLAALSSRNTNIDRLQTDLDFIRKENELLEQQFQRR